MTLLSSFILTAGIAQQQVPVFRENPERDAVRAVAKAMYKELELDKPIKRIEDKYVTETIRENGKWVIIFTKIATEKRISYEWTF